MSLYKEKFAEELVQEYMEDFLAYYNQHYARYSADEGCFDIASSSTIACPPSLDSVLYGSRRTNHGKDQMASETTCYLDSALEDNSSDFLL